MAWAFRQDIQPSAKLVLLALANHANDRWVCFPSRQQLANASSQSRETVTRRLRDLEAAGYISRTEGVREDGGRTSDTYQLMPGRAYQAMRPAHNGGDDTPDEAPPPRQIDEGGIVTADEPPLVTGDKAPLVTADEGKGTISSEPPVLNLPPSPPVGGVGGGNCEIDGRDQFDAFQAAYEPHVEPSASWPQARRVWAGLGTEARAAALMGLSRYLDHCRTRSRKICHPATYLREERWTGFLRAAEPAQCPERRRLSPAAQEVEWALSSGADRTRWPHVDHPSAEWDAWAEVFRVAGRAMPGPSWRLVEGVGGVMDRRYGRAFPLLRPRSTASPPARDAAE